MCTGCTFRALHCVKGLETRSLQISVRGSSQGGHNLAKEKKNNNNQKTKKKKKKKKTKGRAREREQEAEWDRRESKSLALGIRKSIAGEEAKHQGLP